MLSFTKKLEKKIILIYISNAMWSTKRDTGQAENKAPVRNYCDILFRKNVSVHEMGPKTIMGLGPFFLQLDVQIHLRCPNLIILAILRTV